MMRTQRGNSFFEFMVFNGLGITITASLFFGFYNVEKITYYQDDQANHAKQYRQFAVATAHYFDSVGAPENKTIGISILKDERLLPGSFPETTPNGTRLQAAYHADRSSGEIEILIYETGNDKKQDFPPHQLQDQLRSEIQSSFIKDFKVGIFDNTTGSFYEDGKQESLQRFNVNPLNNSLLLIFNSPDSIGYIIIQGYQYENFRGYNNKHLIESSSRDLRDNVITHYQHASAFKFENRGFFIKCPTGVTELKLEDAELKDIVVEDTNNSPENGRETDKFMICLKASRGQYNSFKTHSSLMALNAPGTGFAPDSLETDSRSLNYCRFCWLWVYDYKRDGTIMPGGLGVPSHHYHHVYGSRKTNRFDYNSYKKWVVPLYSIPYMRQKVDTLGADVPTRPHAQNTVSMASAFSQFGEFHVRGYWLALSFVTGTKDDVLWDSADHQRSFFHKYELRISKNKLNKTVPITIPYYKNASKEILTHTVNFTIPE